MEGARAVKQAVVAPEYGLAYAWRAALRLVPGIGFGTEGYPEKVARRLRAVNVTTWLCAIAPFYFAITRALEGRWLAALDNAVMAVAFASIPLLHRFGPSVAPIVFPLLIYVHIFRVVEFNGTGDGGWLGYLTGTALAFLLLGIENAVFAAALAATAAGLIVLVHIVFPHNTGLVSDDGLFYGHFIVNVVINIVALFAVMFYAVRQLNRAEDTAEREHQRSERLLLNILPGKVAARLKEQPEEVIADLATTTACVDVDFFQKVVDLFKGLDTYTVCDCHPHFSPQERRDS